jgi:hypothetical protein
MTRRRLRDTAEGRRLAEAGPAGWRRWGPYTSDRQWGTVREDYSAGGDAWTYFPHAHARSRAYRWGEDALAGFADDQLSWCLGLALWNGRDSILKERLFGLTNAEGNHGEDVKELYFYTDALPSHAYLRMLYRYPQAAFPYESLLAENARRDQSQPEFELLDTGVLDAMRFCDVTVEYARAAPDDTLICITVHNRAAEATRLHVLPHLWARNIWSWSPDAERPSLRLAGGDVLARHPAMPPLRLSCDAAAPFLFCENETNAARLFGAAATGGGPFKDGIGDFVIHGDEAAIRRDHGTKCAAHAILELAAGAQATIRLRLRPELAGPDPANPGSADRATASPNMAGPNTAGPNTASPNTASPSAASPNTASPNTASPSAASPNTASPNTASPSMASPSMASPNAASPSSNPNTAIRNRTSQDRVEPGAANPGAASANPASPNPADPGGTGADPFADFDAIMAARRAEADEFYAVLQQDMDNADARAVQRQALAGMIWSKQFYGFDVRAWLDGDPGQPAPPGARRGGRDTDWQHVFHADIIAMPDKWEYPWYASWDLAFHAVTFALIDAEFAKGQLLLLLRDRAMHPNGQVPAYEWKFGDANPPVQAWAAWRIYCMDAAQTGQGDCDFLRLAFHKLLLNFGWWVNRRDAQGRNIFQGGFLGLDNIEIFDRSQPLPTGGTLQQADGTAWMAAYALHMMRIAMELALDEPVYQDMASKFFEHFLYIARAIDAAGEGAGLWDDQDSFFYDVLLAPDGTTTPLRVHSVVGLIPLFAVHVLEPEMVARLPEFAARMDWFLQHRPDLARLISYWHVPGEGDRRLLALLRTHRMTSLLTRMLDEAEFLSPHGVRAVSRFHHDHPYVLEQDGQRFAVAYLPGESDSRLFGGNSNWRGPVWMPINFILVMALAEFHRFYGTGYRIACPTGSGRDATLQEVAAELTRRLCALFLKGADGRRPVMTAYPGLETGDLVLFHEYFHGETGRGVGASHQTGWSGLVALLLAEEAR